MMFPQISCLNPARLAVVAFFVLCSSAAASALPPNPTLDAQIESSLAHAATQLTATVAYLEVLSAAESNPARRPHFPQFTANTFTTPNSPRPHGHWHTSHATSSFWAKGSFAALLWMMADLAEDPAEQGEWRGWARKWSEPLRNYTGNDLTVNNYAVFRRWMEQAESGAEREAQRQTILEAARLLVVPYDRTSNTGRFLEEAGIYGYRRRAATGVFWFHAFIDHTPNVEQLLAASWLTDDPGEALGFREKAVSHILNLHRTMGPLRSPGEAGSWQRAYFDWEPTSATFGEFLFNEGKQGWSAASTWSRGQAWWLYGCALAYDHTRHPGVLDAARAAARYYVDHLPDNYPEPHRQAGMFVPAWDFDYAYTVDFETDLDSSAAAIAAAGLVRLVAAMGPDDPDYADFLAALEGTLLNLSAAPFLTNDEGPEMSILRHGSYHHFASLEPSSSYDNGLIWGDYFFIDAILAYRALRATSVIVPAAPVVYLTAPGTALSWQAQSAVIYQVETSNDLQIWTDQGLPFAGIEGNVEAALPNSTQPRYWRLRAWSQGLQE